MAGNQGNPIVIHPGNQDNDDVQFMERRVPPAFLQAPRVLLRPASVPPEGPAQAAPGNPGNPVRRRRLGHFGGTFRGQANDHCFNCGKLRWRISVFSSVLNAALNKLYILIYSYWTTLPVSNLPPLTTIGTHVKISQLVNKMCSQQACNNLSQQVVAMLLFCQVVPSLLPTTC